MCAFESVLLLAIGEYSPRYVHLSWIVALRFLASPNYTCRLSWRHSLCKAYPALQDEAGSFIIYGTIEWTG